MVNNPIHPKQSTQDKVTTGCVLGFFGLCVVFIASGFAFVALIALGV